MIHEIILPGVIKKSQANPHDKIIGNVELASCIGYILSDAVLDKIEDFNSPQELLDKYNEIIPQIDKSNITEESINMMEMIDEYKILPMVNEKIDDLHILIDLAYK